MANNITIKDGSGANVTMKTTDVAAVHTPSNRISDGTNNVDTLFDMDTGPGTQYLQGVSLRLSAAGGSIEAKGQQTMASSIPVVVAGDQSAVPVSQSGGWSVSIGAALPAGSNVLGAVTQSGSWSVNQAGSWTVTAQQSTAGNLKAQVQGEAAHDAAAAGNPVLLGAFASAPAPADVSADGDAVRLWADRAGRLQIGDGGSTISIDDGGGSITIDGSVGQSGTWTVATNADATHAAAVPAKALLIAGSDGTNARNLSVNTSGEVKLAALPAGSNTVGNVKLTDGTNFTPAMDAAGRAGFVKVTDGTNTLPAMDASTRPGYTTQVPVTAGGCASYRNLDGNATGANIKASAGQLYGWHIYNNATSARYVKLYNKATAPTVGTDTPKLTIPLPGSSAANVFFDTGIEFDAGLGIGATTGVADSNTGSTAANDVVVNLFYK